MNIKTIETLLKYRETLQSLSQISFSFSTLNHRYPVNELDQSDGENLLRAYLDLLSKSRRLLIEHENEYKEGTH